MKPLLENFWKHFTNFSRTHLVWKRFRISNCESQSRNYTRDAHRENACHQGSKSIRRPNLFYSNNCLKLLANGAGEFIGICNLTHPPCLGEWRSKDPRLGGNHIILKPLHVSI